VRNTEHLEVLAEPVAGVVNGLDWRVGVALGSPLGESFRELIESEDADEKRKRVSFARTELRRHGFVARDAHVSEVWPCPNDARQVGRSTIGIRLTRVCQPSVVNRQLPVTNDEHRFEVALQVGERVVTPAHQIENETGPNWLWLGQTGQRGAQGPLPGAKGFGVIQQRTFAIKLRRMVPAVPLGQVGAERRAVVHDASAYVPPSRGLDREYP